MQEHAEILPIHAEFLANLIFIAVFEENPFQKLAVAFAELFQNLPHSLLCIFGHHCVQNICIFRLDIHLGGILHRIAFGVKTVVLEQDMVTDGVDQCAKRGGIAHAFLAAKQDENTGKSLLPDILNGIL